MIQQIKKNGFFFNELISKNGQAILSSKPFKDRKGLRRNADAIKRAMALDAKKAKSYFIDKTNS